MNKRQVIRSIVFIGILFVVLIYVGKVFDFKAGIGAEGIEEKYNDFNKAKRNSIEAVYLGTSGVDRFWIGPLAYKEQGICVYDLSTGSQPFVLTEYLMKEVKKKHDPQLFIIDIRGVVSDETKITAADVRKVTDNLNLSLNKIKAVQAAARFAEQGGKKFNLEDGSFYLSFIQYHSRWKEELDKNDFIVLNPTNEYKGYFTYLDAFFKISPSVEKPSLTTEREAVSPAMENVIEDLMSYCESLDSEILFVSSPYEISVERQKLTNYAIDIIEEHGYEVLNFNTEEMYETVGINFNTDFYNSGHVNLLGAEKFTRWLSDYVASTYELTDFRGNEQYSDWEEAYDNYVERTKDGIETLRTNAEQVQ